MAACLRVAFILLAAVALLPTSPVLAQVTRDPFVRVDVTQCQTPPRRGSGFVWNAQGSVVTSLHVVAGCGNISIRYTVGGGQLRTARVDRVLPSADLALLSVDNPVAVQPLTSAVTMPGAGAELTVWGYPIQVRGLMDTTFHRRATAGRLEDLLNTALRQEIQNVGMPDLNTDVVLLDGGNLLPGHSGAPLLDRNGQVAAIADGGLERGAVQVSWAIPAGRLADLARSTQRTVNAGSQVGQLFSAELVTAEDTQTFESVVTTTAQAQPSRNRVSYRCGGAVFVYTRTRQLSELRQTADDVIGLDQLINASAGFAQANDRFDIYQELRSGATVVLPAGVQIASIETDRLCLANVVDDIVQMLFHAVAASTPQASQNAGNAYAQLMTIRLGTGWQPDPRWTYTAPIVRFDGLTVWRRANGQFLPGTGLTRVSFETLASKSGLFMAVTTLRSRINPQSQAAEQQCANFRGGAGCELPLRVLKMQALANIATHLSTFPIS